MLGMLQQFQLFPALSRLRQSVPDPSCRLTAVPWASTAILGSAQGHA